MMNWFNMVNDMIAGAMDWVFGWILWLPRDGQIIALAVLTSVMLTLSRRWCADQEWLERCDSDLKVLEGLTREAKKRGDKDSKKRHTDTVNQIRMLSMRQEWRALLGALIPVALLATWAFSRSGYIPLKAGQPVEVRMYLPNSALGQWAHLVPGQRVTVSSGLVQAVVKDEYPTPDGVWDRVNAAISKKLGMLPALQTVARWQVTAQTPLETKLQLRYAGRTYEAPLIAGSRHYAAPVTTYNDSPVQAVEVALKPLKPFGFIGSIDFLFLQPWIVGYLILAFALMDVTRKALRTY